MSEEIIHHAEILWNYHFLDLGVEPSDFILALGSHDKRTAEYAAELFLKGLALLLVTAGGLGKVTEETWTVSEGECFAEIAIEKGVPPEQVIIENKSRNTGDNITHTRTL